MTTAHEVGESEVVVSLELFSQALDEIYLLRTALAYEAEVLGAHLDYATFPKSRRRFADEQRKRMRSSACGQVAETYAGVSFRSLRHSLRCAGAEPLLTRAMWEAERER